MKTVYVVTVGEPYEGYGIIAIYSAKAKALRHVEQFIDDHYDSKGWQKTSGIDRWENFDILTIREIEVK